MVKFFKALLISIPIMLTHIILFYAFIWVKAIGMGNSFSVLLI